MVTLRPPAIGIARPVLTTLLMVALRTAIDGMYCARLLENLLKHPSA